MTASESEPDLARVTISTELAPGERLTMVKLMAYGWSSRRSMPALRDQVDAALAAAMRSGWKGIVDGQRAYLDDVWDRADIELDGDPQLQQAVRFGLFHVLQAAARAEGSAIPAKGLTGRGYDGHTFWDQECFALPVLTYSLPEAARDALRWRHATLDKAVARARELQLAGATFPWRTIRGEECSGYWPAGTAGFHVNAGVADAVRRYVAATGDDEFEVGPGLELLVETARLWRSLGHHDAEGRFRIDGVTGPDEYTALVDNNVYTNLMAARNLRVAAATAARHPERAAELGVDDQEIASWRHAAAAIVIPFDFELGVTSQSEASPATARGTSPRRRPIAIRCCCYPYYLLYSSRVVKQADLVLALYACGDHFDAEQKRRDFRYYEAITVRDSSLSASIQSIVAAEVGQLGLAYEYFRETALVDLHDLTGTTAEGVHLASLAGTARRRRRLRRPARLRRAARLCTTPPRAADEALLPGALSRPAPSRRGREQRCTLRAARGRAARAAPPRRAADGGARVAGGRSSPPPPEEPPVSPRPGGRRGRSGSARIDLGPPAARPCACGGPATLPFRKDVQLGGNRGCS